MAKTKMQRAEYLDYVRDVYEKIEGARAIADILSNADEDSPMEHRTLWRLGALMHQELTAASDTILKLECARL